MADPFGDVADTIDAPAHRAVPIVPSDTTPLPALCKAIYVGTGGTLRMTGRAGDAPQQWINIPSGALIPFRAHLVAATGTTAADMLALY